MLEKELSQAPGDSRHVLPGMSLRSKSPFGDEPTPSPSSSVSLPFQLPCFLFLSYRERGRKQRMPLTCAKRLAQNQRWKRLMKELSAEQETPGTEVTRRQ